MAHWANCPVWGGGGPRAGRLGAGAAPPGGARGWESSSVPRTTHPNQPIIPPMGRTGRRAMAKQAYSMSAVDEYGKVIDDIYDFAEIQGFEIDGILQEGGAGQVEINLNHGAPVALADEIFYFKRRIREAGNALEVRAILDLLRGCGDNPRLRALTLELAAELLCLGGLARERSEADRRVRTAGGSQPEGAGRVGAGTEISLVRGKFLRHADCSDHIWDLWRRSSADWALAGAEAAGAYAGAGGS